MTIVFYDEETYNNVDVFWDVDTGFLDGDIEQEAINQQLFANIMGWA